jgi:Na+-driven multidrug efflux pump
MMALLIKPIVAIWIGHEIEVSEPLVISVGLYVLISTWNNIFAMLVNGVGAIKLQLYTSVVAMIINVPLAILFVRWFGLGLSGVVLATVISLFMAAVVLPFQVFKIIQK